MAKSNQTEKKAYTIPLFCEAYGISRSALYNAFKRGYGPRIMKVGRRTLISVDAAETWRAQLEAHSALSPCPTRNGSGTARTKPEITAWASGSGSSRKG